MHADTSIEVARAILVAAAAAHPEEPIIHYNFGCYDCQLGALDPAKEHLARALRLQPQCRLMALDGEDLRALWETRFKWRYRSKSNTIVK